MDSITNHALSIDSALDCAAKGWPIFPLKANGKAPATPNGFKDASTDPAIIEKWFERNPKYNYGIATGKVSGIIVVDIDVKGGKQGIASLNDLGLGFDTFIVKTPSGGWHYYYKYQSGVGCKTGLLPGIDIRGDGGYVVGPGSIIDGQLYEVVSNA